MNHHPHKAPATATVEKVTLYHVKRDGSVVMTVPSFAEATALAAAPARIHTDAFAAFAARI